jgi:hypothetical protein
MAVRDDDAGRHRGMPIDGSFYFRRLDAISKDFDLLISAPHIGDVSIRQTPG